MPNIWEMWEAEYDTMGTTIFKLCLSNRRATAISTHLSLTLHKGCLITPEIHHHTKPVHFTMGVWEDLKITWTSFGLLQYNLKVLYTNIDLNLRNKLHGPMHYKKGVTCVYNGHEIYTLLLQHNNLIHLFQNSADRIMNLRVSGQCSYAIILCCLINNMISYFKIMSWNVHVSQVLQWWDTHSMHNSVPSKCKNLQLVLWEILT